MDTTLQQAITATLAKSGTTYVDRATGRTLRAIASSYLLQCLREQGWRRLPSLGEFDYELGRAGWVAVRANTNPNNGLHGDWCVLHADGSHGRTVAKWTTLWAAKGDTQ